MGQKSGSDFLKSTARTQRREYLHGVLIIDVLNNNFFQNL